MDSVDAAYFAGLFEGEGCISKTVRRNKWGDASYYALKVSMTDLDVIEGISERTGYQSLLGPYQRGDNKPSWSWECQNRLEMVRILTAIRSHLYARRRARVDEVLAWSAAKDARAARRLIECRAGHDLTVENATYIDSKGTVMCRLCRNEDRRERNARRKQERA